MDCDTAGEKLSSAIYIISIIQGIADAGRAHEQSSRSLSAISLHLMDIYYQVPGIYHKAWRARPISIHGTQNCFTTPTNNSNSIALLFNTRSHK